MIKSVRLWERDYQILGLLDWNIFSCGQLARLFFGSQKKCGQRMKLLFVNGLVSRFQKPLLDVRGKPEFIYCMKGKSVRKFSRINHLLAVSEFRVLLVISLRALKDVCVKFFSSSRMSLLFGGVLVPDAGFVLEKKGKGLLYFLEVDLGTESLESSKNYGFGAKLDLYADYFDTKVYAEDFVGFFGFRVLAVFSSEKRLEHFVSIAGKKGADFVLCSTLERLNDGGLMSDCWTNSEGHNVNVFCK